MSNSLFALLCMIVMNLGSVWPPCCCGPANAAIWMLILMYRVYDSSQSSGSARPGGRCEPIMSGSLPFPLHLWCMCICGNIVPTSATVRTTSRYHVSSCVASSIFLAACSAAFGMRADAFLGLLFPSRLFTVLSFGLSLVHPGLLPLLLAWVVPDLHLIVFYTSSLCLALRFVRFLPIVSISAHLAWKPVSYRPLGPVLAAQFQP